MSSPPDDLPFLLRGDYTPSPCNRTVVDHAPYNLPSLGIVINLDLRCLICIHCERAIDVINLVDHIKKDLPLVEIPDEIATSLETTFQLVPYSSVVYAPRMILPVFGIPLHPEPLFFCGCGRGYATYEVLRTHQTRSGDRSCPMRAENPGYHRGYGQRLTSNRSFFEVDPSKWVLETEHYSEYPSMFTRSLPPLRDYSTMEIKGPEDEMNTSSFFYTQRWFSHLEGFTPTDIQEVVQQSTREVTYGERLRLVAEEFLLFSNNDIKAYNSFGILKLMGQTTE